jgi:hypothetical protein
MKTTYFLKLEIELAELKLKLANHRLDKYHAMENEKYEQAADTRKWEKEIKTHIRSLIEGAIYTFTYHVQKDDRKIYRPQLERFLSEANLALQSKTANNTNLDSNLDKESNPTVAIMRENQPSSGAKEAFQEHFSHTFVQLTALHEKLMEEGKYEEAGKVLEQCLTVSAYIQKLGDERYLG